MCAGAFVVHVFRWLLRRYLKDCMWKATKKRELEMRRQVQILYRDLVLMSKLDEGREKVCMFCTFWQSPF